MAATSKFWDFVFYALFGCVVTSSVKLVGVLLVFAFLVLPLLTVALSKDSFKSQLLQAWGLCTLGSFLGLWLSVLIDIPPSYCVILTLCGIWILSIFKQQVSR
mgnify:CR=1 FL=1